MISEEEVNGMVFEESAPATDNAAKVRNEEMNLAWQFIAETNVSVFLTGKAGTGKTTFLRKLRERLPKRMVVLAPTGVAAINAQGQTIHSFFQLPFGPMVPGAQVERKTYYKVGKDKKNIIKTLDLLVIDEISMVRCDLLDAIDMELRKYRDRDKPFGGVQLLLIGDLQQLAPVAKESEWALLKDYYYSQYFFGSKALSQIPLVTIELQHIYRQSDATFIELLAKVRNNAVDDSTLSMLNARYIPDFEPEEGAGWIRLTTHNHLANTYNEQKLEAIASKAIVSKAEIHKNFPEASYPADETLVLKVGAQVMFIKNDPSSNHEYYNGKIGVVKGLDGEGNIIVWCKEDNRNVSVGRVDWENTKYVMDEVTKEIREEVEGTFTQYPLRLAWAITIHKSQGLTFDHAVLDINGSFAHGQTYVALSRCRTLEGMVLARPMSKGAVVTDASVNQYMEGELVKSQNTMTHLPQMRFDYYLSLLDDMYSFTGLQQDYNYLVRVVDEHLYRQHPEYLALLKSKQDDVQKALVNVSVQFRNQYLQIMQQEGLNSEHLKERIGASSAYFLAKMKELFDPIKSAWNLTIGNKQVKTQYTNALDAFKLTLAVKMGVFKYIGGDGFSVKSYLRAKAKSTLDELEPGKGKGGAKDGSKTRDAKIRGGAKCGSGKGYAQNGYAPNEYAVSGYDNDGYALDNDGYEGVLDINGKTEKKPKRQKGDSERESLAMFKEGMSVAEIANVRSLTQSTIYGHFETFIATGEVKLEELVSPERQEKIKAVYSSIGNEEERKLSAMKALLPEDYSYGEIKLVIGPQTTGQ